MLAAGSLLVGALLTGCGSSSPSAPGTPTGSGSTSTASGPTIKIKDFGYGAALTVAPGATVTVENEDGVRHNVSGAAFRTDLLGQGQRATFTAPSQPGTYSFTCSVHASMHGTLVVRAGAGGTASSSQPASPGDSSGYGGY
jgi:plastocyanin